MSSVSETNGPLLRIRGLGVDFVTPGRPMHTALAEVELELEAGRVLGLVGESGSGKSTLGRVITGTLPEAGRVRGGIVEVQGRSVLPLTASERRALRGGVIGYIPQDAVVSLDPLVPVGVQAGSPLRVHTALGRSERRERVIEWFARVGLRSPETVYHRYPHELSGGMCQRVLIAAALSTTPALIIADEPTSALDVTVQKTILDVIAGLAEAEGIGMLLVTHDLAVAAERSESLLVLQHGRVVEQGATAEVLRNPRAEYTRNLIGSSSLGWRADADRAAGRIVVAERVPDARASASETALAARGPIGREPGASASVPIIEAQGITRTFVQRRRRGAAPVTALRDVSVSVPRGGTLGVVGESGSGKTTLARIIAGLERPDEGRVLFDGQPQLEAQGGRRTFRAAPETVHRHLQVVYQNPYSSLDPRMTIAQILREPLTGHRAEGGRTRHTRRIDELLDATGLPATVQDRYPAELSGGQRQRVAIARALAPEPQVLILDEPVSALDVTVQRQILDLLTRLQRELSLSYLLISHDLSVIADLAHRVDVLFHGELVESGETAALLAGPRTDYLRALLDAVPGTTIGDPR